jgi:septation ring formation regulator EzrA
MMTFLITAGVVVAVVIIITLTQAKKKPKSVIDNLTENKNFQDMKSLVDAMSELNKHATADDTMPEQQLK